MSQDAIFSLKSSSSSGRAPTDSAEEPSFKGTLQALTAFREPLRQASPDRRRVLAEVMLKTIAQYEVGDRPGRVEPRAIKRRPKPHDLLMQPRRQERKRLLSKA